MNAYTCTCSDALLLLPPWFLLPLAPPPCSPSLAVTCGLYASETFSQQLEAQLQTQPSQTAAHLAHTTMQRTMCHILHLSLIQLQKESPSLTNLVLAMNLSQMTSLVSTGMALLWQGRPWTVLSDTLSALR